MTVIAKMNVSSVTLYGGDNRSIKFNCVYDSELANEDNENYRFTKASPWGELTMMVMNEHLQYDPGDTFYIQFHDSVDGRPEAAGAHSIAKFKCESITDFGGTSKQAHLTTVYSSLLDEGFEEDKLFTKYTPSGELKMTIDNPAASIQFEPGKVYYLVFLKASVGLSAAKAK